MSDGELLSLLLRPDYIADEFGKDTYLAHVCAGSPTTAIEMAQGQAWLADNGGSNEFVDPNDVFGDPRDYAALLVCRGHQLDLRT